VPTLVRVHSHQKKLKIIKPFYSISPEKAFCFALLFLIGRLYSSLDWCLREASPARLVLLIVNRSTDPRIRPISQPRLAVNDTFICCKIPCLIRDHTLANPICQTREASEFWLSYTYKTSRSRLYHKLCNLIVLGSIGSYEVLIEAIP
jgi:hypothetical protein